MSLVTPLNRVLGLGSAKEGVQHWWRQRLSAVALVPLTLWLALALLGLPDWSHQSVIEWMSAPLSSVLLVLTVLTLALHSQLGVQVVIEDYVHGNGAKIAGLILSAFVHIVVAAVGVFSILRVAFGAAG